MSAKRGRPRKTTSYVSSECWPQLGEGGNIEAENLPAKRRGNLSIYCLFYVFATVPDSSINSWDSSFIFNLQKNKHLLLHE
jgi:hypothetical protein